MRQAGITTILAASVAVTILAGVAALVLYASGSSFTMIETVQQNALTQAAAISAQSAEIYLKGTASVAESLAGQDAIRAAFDGDTARGQERLRNTVAAYKDYYSFFLFDTAGTIVAGSTSDGKDLTGGDRKEQEVPGCRDERGKGPDRDNDRADDHAGHRLPDRARGSRTGAGRGRR